MTKFIAPPSLFDDHKATINFFKNLLYKITGKESVKPTYTYLGIEYTLRIITKDVNHQRDITWIDEWNDNPFSHTLPQYLRYETDEQVSRIKKAGGFMPKVIYSYLITKFYQSKSKMLKNFIVKVLVKVMKIKTLVLEYMSKNGRS